jgi:hypothetical protein
VPKITRQDRDPNERKVIRAKTRAQKDGQPQAVLKWWLEKDEKIRAGMLLTTAAFLKESQSYRYRQAAIYARLYGNQSLFNFVGNNISQLDKFTGLPFDRPTRNVIQSIIDTLVSRITQNRPTPVFLTDGGDYKERNLAKKLNNFIRGELYQTQAYDKAEMAFRDCLIEGTGVLKVYERQDHKVGIDRVLLTEILIDPNEGKDGDPRQLYQLRLVDRDQLLEMFPKMKEKIELAAQAFPDSSADSSKTVADLVMVVEGWRLPSGKNAEDGHHTIACSEGELYGESWVKDKFPFVFLHYAPRLLGFWSQGIAERQMGTQLDINSILFQISRAIKLVGVPRVYMDAASKVLNTSWNSDIGAIIKYSGTKPDIEVHPCVPPELYEQLDKETASAFQMEGVSSLQATSQKPAGLNSGEAIRSYDDISTDRFASTSRKWSNLFIDLSYQIIELAQDIAKEQGSYETVYPDKRKGTQGIDLPDCELLKNPFVIQCYEMSSLPKDPAGRLQKITEMVQAGMVTLREGRRLLDFQDLDQIETLENAAEERIYQVLDMIIEDSVYTPPDSFIDIALADKIVVQYINLYSQFKLEESKMQKLRDFFTQIQALKQAAQPAPQTAPGAVPQAAPEAPPQSPLIPNAPVR